MLTVTGQIFFPRKSDCLSLTASLFSLVCAHTHACTRERGDEGRKERANIPKYYILTSIKPRIKMNSVANVNAQGHIFVSVEK